MKTADILIKNALILCFDKKMSIVRNGFIAIVGKHLEAIDDMAGIDDWTGKEIIDGSGFIAIPGFINGHTHAGMSYFKGMADDMPLIQWLEKKIWPAEAKFMNADFVRLGVEHAAAEMIKSGITTFNDMYFYSREAAISCHKVGIRAILGEGVIDFPVAEHKKAQDSIDYSVNLQEANTSDLVSFSIAPHAIYTCSRENLLNAAEMAYKMNMNLHIHVAETMREVEECIKQNGLRPIEYLDEVGIFKANTILAHGIYLDDKELEILSEKNVSIVVNTISNLKLASGFAPIQKYEKLGVNYCLGTDGVASNNKLDMLAEISTTARLHKALTLDAAFLPAVKVLQASICGGAKTLNLHDQIGSLEKGKLADLIMINIDTIESQPMYDPYSHLVYSISTEQIKHVIINGRIIMQDRKLLTVDEEELISRAKEYRSRISLI